MALQLHRDTCEEIASLAPGMSFLLNRTVKISSAKLLTGILLRRSSPPPATLISMLQANELISETWLTKTLPNIEIEEG